MPLCNCGSLSTVSANGRHSSLRLPTRTRFRYHGGLPGARDGVIAQLEERLHGMQEVGGSSPPDSTTPASIHRYPEPMVERLWAPWRMAYIGEARTNDGPSCFLCNAVQNDTPDSLRVELSSHTLTVLNRFPYSGGHLMVAPRRHVPDLLVLTLEESTALMTAAQRAIRALQRAFAPDGFNLGVNHGSVAGGSVETHLHMHVVPRWSGDTNFMPIMADVKVIPELLLTTAARLRQAFAAEQDA